MDDHDPITQKALFRYQIISGYLASDPPWGKRPLILEQLAAKPWMLQNQIALQAIIRAAIRKVDKIDESFLKQQVFNGSLFDGKLQE